MPRTDQIKRAFLTIGKCAFLFVLPTIVGALTSLGWYLVFYRGSIHFTEKLEGIVTGWWTLQFSVLYNLLVAIAVNTVWTEYKTMRAAVRRYDFDTFVDLVDESLSPIMHTSILVVSLGMLLGFLLLRYPDPMSGAAVTFGVGFLLMFMLVVVIEMDDPCSGIWSIKGIPEEWLVVDAKQYRAERSRQAREEFIRKYGQAGNETKHRAA